MAERVLTLRELNRATLARQLLLERKRLSPAAVIERLVGMQAQWPPAPYIGIWTRTTSFRRQALERELASAAVVRATVMRQTLHLVTPRDYALVRAAMSETNFPWESPQAKLLAPSVRALTARAPSPRRKRLPISSASTGSPESLRAAPGAAPACAPISCTTPRPRSGTHVATDGSWRSRNRSRTTRPRREPRCSVGTSPLSGLRHGATSSPGP